MNTFRPPQTLTTSRLQLRPLTEADAPLVFDGYASCADAVRFMPFSQHRYLDDSIAFARRCDRCWRDGTAFPWAIEQLDTGLFLGCIELRILRPKADFGYILGVKYWGNGYATEAARAVVAAAMNLANVHRVWATCHPDNVASIRVLEKAGLCFETRLRNWETRPNLGEAAGDCLVYSMLRAK